QERAHVGVAPRYRSGAVDHRHHLRLHELLGRHPVEVLVVDDGDVARVQALDEVLGATVDARRPHQRRRRRRPIGHAHASRWREATASSSSAWPRATSLEGCPESIRDSSTTRSGPCTGWARATVRPSRSSLPTATCSWAKAATWGRWVTTRTWWSAATAARALPTASAASPPT